MNALKKCSALFLSLTLAASLFTGCQSGGEAAKTPAPETAPAETQSAAPTSAPLDYPTGPINVIIPKGAGGPTDTVARLLLQYAQEEDSRLNFVTVNNPGANGVIGMTQGAMSKPDGYNLTMIVVELCIMPNIESYNCPVTPADFRGITAPIANPALVVVRTDSGIADIYDYIDQMDAGFKVGTAGTNSIHDLAAKALAEAYEKEYTAVPYADGESAAVNALIASNPEIDAIMVGPSASLKAQIEAGTLKVLGVLGESHVSIAPEAPLLSELEGDYSREITARAWAALAAPDDIDEGVYQYLVDLFAKVTAGEGFQTAMREQGIDPLEINGAECDQMVQDDFDFYKNMLAG